jgi:hypothetical protein
MSRQIPSVGDRRAKAALVLTKSAPPCPTICSLNSSWNEQLKIQVRFTVLDLILGK